MTVQTVTDCDSLVSSKKDWFFLIQIYSPFIIYLKKLWVLIEKKPTPGDLTNPMINRLSGLNHLEPIFVNIYMITKTNPM